MDDIEMWAVNKVAALLHRMAWLIERGEFL